MKLFCFLGASCIAIFFYHAGNRFRLGRINLRSQNEIQKRIAKYQREIELKNGNAEEIEKIKNRIDELKWVSDKQQ